MSARHIPTRREALCKQSWRVSSERSHSLCRACLRPSLCRRYQGMAQVERMSMISGSGSGKGSPVLLVPSTSSEGTTVVVGQPLRPWWRHCFAGGRPGPFPRSPPVCCSTSLTNSSQCCRAFFSTAVSCRWVCTYQRLKTVAEVVPGTVMVWLRTPKSE